MLEGNRNGLNHFYPLQKKFKHDFLKNCLLPFIIKEIN